MYVRFIEWDYNLEEDSYERCFSAPASQEDIDREKRIQMEEKLAGIALPIKKSK